MARPEKHDAEYFPFYAKDGRTLHILETKYGCEGTGFFTNVMRFLTLQPDHHFCIKEESDLLYFFSRCKCDYEKGLDMLDIMSKTCKIHTHLWVSYKVITSEDLLNSLQDAYRNRKNPIITIDEIIVYYTGNPQEPVVSDVVNTQEPVVSEVSNTQSKVKKSKVKEKKIQFLDFVFITKEEHKRLLSEYGSDQVTKMIHKLDNYIGQNPKKNVKKYTDHNRVLRGWVAESLGIVKISTNNQPKIIKCVECKIREPVPGDELCIQCFNEKYPNRGKDVGELIKKTFKDMPGHDDTNSKKLLQDQAAKLRNSR